MESTKLNVSLLASALRQQAQRSCWMSSRAACTYRCREMCSGLELLQKQVITDKGQPNSPAAPPAWSCPGYSLRCLTCLETESAATVLLAAYKHRDHVLSFGAAKVKEGVW